MNEEWAINIYIQATIIAVLFGVLGACLVAVLSSRRPQPTAEYAPVKARDPFLRPGAGSGA